MTTLLALYRRPDGGPEALGDVRAALRARSTCRSSPATPGLRATRVRRVTGRSSASETDLVLVTAMDFDDRAALDAGLALRRDARRGPQPARDRAGPGHALVLEDAPELDAAGSPAVDTVGTTTEERP